MPIKEAWQKTAYFFYAYNLVEACHTGVKKSFLKQQILLILFK